MKLMVGAGDIRQDGWLSTDRQLLDLLAPHTWERFFAPGDVAAIQAEHVWEHLSEAEGLTAARTCYRFLRPGGHARIAVPDGLHPDPAYIDYVKPGGSGAGADDHQVLYTYRSLGSVFAAAGFEVRLLEYFDESGRFHYSPWDPEDGLIRRSSRNDRRNRDGRLAYTSLILDAVKRPVPARRSA